MTKVYTCQERQQTKVTTKTRVYKCSFECELYMAQALTIHAQIGRCDLIRQLFLLLDLYWQPMLYIQSPLNCILAMQTQCHNSAILAFVASTSTLLMVIMIEATMMWQVSLFKTEGQSQESHRCCVLILSTSSRVKLAQPDSEDGRSPLMNAAYVHATMVSCLAACLEALQQLIWVPGQPTSEASHMPPFWAFHHSQLAHWLPLCNSNFLVCAYSAS